MRPELFSFLIKIITIVNLHRSFRCLLIYLLISNQAIVAQEIPKNIQNEEKINVEVVESSISFLTFSPELTTIIIRGLLFSGLGASAHLTRKMNNDFLISAGLSQGFSRRDNFASLYTSFNFRLLYSLTKSNGPETQEISLGSKAIAKLNKRSKGGLFLEATAKQYFFNFTRGAEPYSGFGIGGVYQFGAAHAWVYGLGVGIDHLSNGRNTVIVYRGSLNFSYFL